MEPIIHIIIPTLVLLAFMPEIDKKLILALMPLTVIPDVDLLLGMHRYLFHNIFFVLIVTGIVYLISNRKNIFKFKNLLPAGIALFFLTAHLVLDFGGPGIGLFYPLYDKLIKIDLLATTTNGNIKLTIATNPLSAATMAQPIPIATTSGLLLLIVFAPFFTIWVLKKEKKRREVSF